MIHHGWGTTKCIQNTGKVHLLITFILLDEQLFSPLEIYINDFNKLGCENLSCASFVEMIGVILVFVYF